MIFICLSLTGGDSPAETSAWMRLDKGLYLGEFDPKQKSRICHHKIIILKIDPKRYPLRLLSASEHGGKQRTAKHWCKEFGLQAAINASMYQNMDLLKSTGYMRNYDDVNNAYLNRNFGSLLVFNPTHPSLPQVQMIDRRLQRNWKSIMEKYHTVVQNYRMITQGKKRGWPQRRVIHGAAAVGMDMDDNVLFILSRSPYSTHDLIHILLSLPIKIRDAMYVEGGPEATLYFQTGVQEESFTGTCEAGSNEDGYYKALYKIPNIIGISRRQ